MRLRDTIVAIATPPGRGGLGIVRLSGSASLDIATGLVRSRHPLSSWTPARGELLDQAGHRIDDVLITFFGQPRSYTGEDVVEIACHGSPVVLRQCVDQALRRGARLAEPGEFTLRAFVNGRVDLPQAEAVRDLIEATTLQQARVAAQQAGGALARTLHPVKAQLLDLIALLEAGIDFAEDDISVATGDQLAARLHPIRDAVGRLAHSFGYGQVLREGFSLVIVGRPNVGKSSLFNRLLEQDRAIVTEIPGTTRDLVSENTAIEGIPVRLMDTAGIREGESVAETLGIERSFEAMADADLTLVVVDASAPAQPGDRELIERAREGGRFLVAANKSDLGPREHPGDGAHLAGDGAHVVSAKTGAGIDALRAAIVHEVAPAGSMEEGGVIIPNLRQESLLREALSALQGAAAALTSNLPHELLLLDLYAALGALDGLTGKTTADDILNRIFSTFCIGK